MLHEERKRVKVFSGYLNLEATAGGVLWEKGLGFIKKETPAWVFCELWQISSLLFYKTDLWLLLWIWKSDETKKSVAITTQYGQMAKCKIIFKFGKNSVFCGNHFHWRPVTWIKTILQGRCFYMTKATAGRCS